MGICTSKPNPFASNSREEEIEASHNTKSTPNNGNGVNVAKNDAESVKRSPIFPFYSPSPAHYLFSKKSPAVGGNKSANSTPGRFFKRPFPPPSPAKHIKALLARRHGKKVDAAAAIPEGEEAEGAAAAARGLDKSFGFSKQFTIKYEVGEEVGRGHFGYTLSARFKKGDLKGQQDELLY